MRNNIGIVRKKFPGHTKEAAPPQRRAGEGRDRRCLKSQKRKREMAATPPERGEGIIKPVIALLRGRHKVQSFLFCAPADPERQSTVPKIIIAVSHTSGQESRGNNGFPVQRRDPHG